MNAFEIAGNALAVALAVAAAVRDTRSMQIPNWLTFPGMAVGLALGLAGGELRSAAVSLGVCFAVGFFLWLFGCFGEGDAKLFAALGSLAGADAAFLGLALSLPFLLFWVAPARLKKFGLRGWLREEVRVLTGLFMGMRPDKARAPFDPVPFAPFLCVGFVLGLAILRMGVL